MIGANAGNCGEPQELCGLDPDNAVQNDILFIDQNGIAKAEGGDRVADLTQVRRLNFTHIAHGSNEVTRRAVDKLEFRHKVVAYGGNRHGDVGELR
jgi:hypothetical protein